MVQEFINDVCKWYYKNVHLMENKNVQYKVEC